MPIKNKPFKNEPFKKKRFRPIPVEVGTVYYDYYRAQPGYYNNRKIISITDKLIKVVAVDFDGNAIGSEYEEVLKLAQICKSNADRQQHDKNEQIRELEHNILCKISLFLCY